MTVGADHTDLRSLVTEQWGAETQAEAAWERSAGEQIRKRPARDSDVHPIAGHTGSVDVLSPPQSPAPF